MKRRLFQEGEEQSGEINISPLIDVVFILLIFFIVTTTFVDETGVEVTKPQAISSQQLQRESIMIAITNDEQVIYGGRNIGTAGVRPLVERLLSRGDIPVVVMADGGVNTSLLVDVIDEAKIAGAVSVNIATRNE